MTNKLYYGDNLEVLREHVADTASISSTSTGRGGGGRQHRGVRRHLDLGDKRQGRGPKPKLPPLISPDKKASRVETRVSHQKGAQGELL